MTFVRRIPLPLSALALALAALGNLLLPYSAVIRSVCGAASVAVVVLVLVRVAFDTEGVRAELSAPGALATFPTLFMALLILATYLKPLAAGPALVLWIVALVLQLVLVVAFVLRHVIDFKLAQVLPAWFLVFVGFVVASVTSPAFGMQSIGRVLLYAGLLGYALVLPVVVVRLVKAGPLPAPALPTLAIFAAPPSLCLVGYLAVAPAKEPALVFALLAVAAVSVIFVLTRLPGLVVSDFAPSHAALTFPFVISATAVKQSSAFFSANSGVSPVPGVVIIAMDVLAAGIVLLVAARFVVHLTRPAGNR